MTLLLPRVWRLFKRLMAIALVILCIGFLIPEQNGLPVDGMAQADYNQESFWYYPWGKSGTHKGVDVFGKSGTNVLASEPGLVVFAGVNGRGGNAVIVLGPKWRFHYYAHLQSIEAAPFQLVSSGSKVGTLGSSGNAAGKAPHLHYSIFTGIPYVWQYDASLPQASRKLFFIDPVKRLNEHFD